MNKRQVIIISIVGIVIITLTLIGLTYGYYLTRIQGNTNDKSISINMSYLELTYSDGNGTIEATNIIPGETITSKTFTVTNTGTDKISNYVIYLDDVINTFADKSDLLLTLTCTSDKNSCNGTKIEYPSNNTVLITNDIEKDETQSYELKVEFLETNDDQNDNMNKKLSGNIVIKDIKSLDKALNSINGTNNIKIDNASLINNYRIYGNSTQGTNLIPSTVSDLSNWTANSNNYYYYLDDYIGNSSKVTVSFKHKLYDKTGTNLDYIGYFYLLSSTDDWQSYTREYIFIQNTTLNGFEYTLEKQEGKRYSLFWFGVSDIYANIYDIEVKDTPTPTTVSEISSVGDLVTDTSDVNYGKYKIPLEITGKNKFNLNAVELNDVGEIIDNGIKWTKSGSVDIKMSAGKYTISFKNEGTGSIYLRNGKVNNGYILMLKNTDTYKTFNFTSSVDGYLRFSCFNAGQTLTNIQIEENTEVTDYEEYQEPITNNIYLDEPLRKVGNYSDYIDFKSQKVIRNVYEGVLDGTESWTLGGTSTNDYQTFYTRKYLNKALNGDRNCLSDKFSNVTSISIWTGTSPYLIQTGLNDRVCYVTLPKTIASSITEAKQFFSENNSKYYFILSTPTSSNINLPNIFPDDKTKIININTTTSPSNILVEYLN